MNIESTNTRPSSNTAAQLHFWFFLLHFVVKLACALAQFIIDLKKTLLVSASAQSTVFCTSALGCLLHIGFFLELLYNLCSWFFTFCTVFSISTAKFPKMGSIKSIDSILFSTHMQVLSDTDNHGVDSIIKKPRLF